MIHLFSQQPNPGGFSDEELRIAAQAVRNAMLDSLKDDPELHHSFSEQFLRRMETLFRLDARRSRQQRAFQHAAILIIGFFLSGLLFLAFNPEARADFTRWVRSVYEKSIFYQSLSDEDLEHNESLDGLPEVDFSWLPGDYEIRVVSDSPRMRRILLVNSEDLILLEYQILDDDYYLEVFTDEYTHEIVNVNGASADLYVSNTPDAVNALVWTIEERSIIFALNADLPKHILIKIANNISLS